MAKLEVDIVTGERVILHETDVDMVIAPGADGTLGILPKHAPLISTLAAGELRVKKGGREESIVVYGGFIDKVPMGAAFGKGLTLKMGQTHVHRYLRPLLRRIEEGQIDPSFLITHRLPLSEAPYAYEIFKQKQENCIKVVLRP